MVLEHNAEQNTAQDDRGSVLLWPSEKSGRTDMVPTQMQGGTRGPTHIPIKPKIIKAVSEDRRSAAAKEQSDCRYVATDPASLAS